MADFLVHLSRPQFEPPTAKESDVGSFSLVVSGLAQKNDSVAPRNRKPCTAPAYGRRVGWVPRSQDDFGNGGAYPEVPVSQFPLNMGKKPSASGKVVPLQTGPDGKLQYDAIVKQNRGGGLTDKIVYTKAEAQKAQYSKPSELVRPDEEEEQATVDQTKLAIEAILEEKQNAGVVQRTREREPTYVKYTPNQQAPGHNANCAQRIIRLVAKQIDPLEPAKFKNKRVPRSAPSPPPPVQHSPNKKLTKDDQESWRI
eukprot:Selendium_serpulae@DN5899_c0_g1_i3.p1